MRKILTGLIALIMTVPTTLMIPTQTVFAEAGRCSLWGGAPFEDCEVRDIDIENGWRKGTVSKNGKEYYCWENASFPGYWYCEERRPRAQTPIRRGPDVTFRWDAPLCTTMGAKSCVVTGYKVIADLQTTAGVTTRSVVLPATTRSHTWTSIAAPDPVGSDIGETNHIEARARVIALYNNNTIESPAAQYVDIYTGRNTRYNQTCYVGVSEKYPQGTTKHCAQVSIMSYDGNELRGGGWDGWSDESFYCINSNNPTDKTWSCTDPSPRETNINYGGMETVEVSWATPRCTDPSVPEKYRCEVVGYYAKLVSSERGIWAYAPNSTPEPPSVPLSASTKNADILLGSMGGTYVHGRVGAVIKTDPNYFNNSAGFPGLSSNTMTYSISSEVFGG